MLVPLRFGVWAPVSDRQRLPVEDAQPLVCAWMYVPWDESVTQANLCHCWLPLASISGHVVVLPAKPV